MTNEHIMRHLTDKELAHFLNAVVNGNVIDCEADWLKWLEWLKEEVEDEHLG